MNEQSPRPLRLQAIRYGAEQIALFEFAAPDGGELAPFTAGAHVDVHLPNGLVRPYSLANDPRERHRYVVGVKRDAAGRGGSRCLHDEVRVGMLLPVGEPRNLFPLNEAAPAALFVSGGIGITPIRAMIHRAEALGLNWTLHHAVRRRAEAALLDGLFNDPRVNLHVDEEQGGRPLELAALAAGAPPGAHAYCCGPAPMIDAFEAAFAGWDAARRHVERFAPPAAMFTPGAGFAVRLARAGRVLQVPADRSILETLRGAGIDAPASCEQGVCGACETRVLAGAPEHRDLLLSPEERAAGRSMMICCSRSLDPELVLDL